MALPVTCERLFEGIRLKKVIVMMGRPVSGPKEKSI